MSMLIATGTFSQVMYGSQQRGMLEAAFVRLLGQELEGSPMDARGMGQFATQVAASVSDHFEGLSAALPWVERENIEIIARDNGADPRAATIEYLSNAYLFRALRDYFGLPPTDIFPQFDLGGFLVFTRSGSIVASPPGEALSDRTFHYTRMPSRTKTMKTGTQSGELRRDIAVGHRMKTTEFNTSPIQRLLTIPRGQADLFEAIHESSIVASISVSRFVTREK